MHIGLAAVADTIHAVALDASGKPCWRGQTPLPTHRQGLFQSITQLLAQAESRLGCDCSFGLALPGPVPVSENHPMLQWLSTPIFVQLLRQELSRPMSVAGHFPCLVLADMLRSGADSSVALELGEHCAMLATFGKTLSDYAFRGGSNLCHTPLPAYSLARDGVPQPCECGNVNCIDKFVSLSAFELRYWENFGIRQSGSQILAAAAAGEMRAQYHLHHFHDALSRVLGRVFQTYAPARILLHSPLLDEHSLEQISGMLADSAHPVSRVELALLEDGPEAAALGAAWLPQGRPEQQQCDPRPDFEVQLNQLPFHL